MGEEASGGPAPRRAALWIAVTAVVIGLSPWIPIPGIDREVLAELTARAGVETAFSVIGIGIGTLIAIRLLLAALGKSESPVARRIALAVYLVIAAIQSLAIAFWLESLNFELAGDVVLEPGWRFRAIATLAGMSGAALLYWLADRIDQTRAATGALALGLVAALHRAALDASTLGDAILAGAPAWEALTELALPIAMLVLAIALAARPPTRWPVTIYRSLELRSPFDALAVPPTLAVLAGPSLAPTPPLVRAALVLAITVGVVVLLRARVDAASSRRSLWPIGLAIVALGLVVVPASIGVVSSGALSQALEPGPLEGEARFEITLAAVDRFADEEGEAMIAHLSALGARASLVSADAEQITIRVEAARDVESVLAALRPHTLELHLVEPFPDIALPDGVSAPSAYSPAAEGPCDALEPFTLRSDVPFAIERVAEEPGLADPDAPPPCRLYALDPRPIVTGADVADAEAMLDSYTEQPIVSVTLDDDAATRFERATRENIRRHLAIVVDGEIASAPIIQSAIPGGHVQITLGGYRDYGDLLLEAEALASALRSGATGTSEWTLESQQP